VTQPRRYPKINVRQIFGLIDFRLLQQYRHEADMPAWSLYVRSWERKCLNHGQNRG
jgi:hypothetical protein